MKQIIEDLNWRYAVKQYDPSKIISNEQLEIIKESLRLTPSAYGLQPLKFIFIDTPSLREEIKPIAYNQAQVVDASHLLIICAHTHLDEPYIDTYVDRVKELRNTPAERAAGFSDFLKKNVLAISKEDMEPWNVRQAYIALGQVLHTCASLRIDATPMEGFNAQALDELLGLQTQGLKSVLLCPIGFRSNDDAYQHLPKVRKAPEKIFETR
jgi:nitroreductase